MADFGHVFLLTGGQVGEEPPILGGGEMPPWIPPGPLMPPLKGTDIFVL